MPMKFITSDLWLAFSELIRSNQQEKWKNWPNISDMAHIPRKTLLSLLESDDLKVTSEEHAFESVIAWVRHDILRRRRHASNLLCKLRLHLISGLYLRRRAYKEPEWNTEEVDKLIQQVEEREKPTNG